MRPIILQGSPEALNEDVVHQTSRPSMLMRTSALPSTLVKACDVNWLP